MPKRAEGGFIGATPTWISSARSGVWSMERQLELQRAELWPVVSTGGYRYWRANGFTGVTSYLDMTELQLWFDGVHQSGATITSSDSPLGGNVSTLANEDVSSGGRVYWSEATAEGAGFWIKYDYGVGNSKTIDGVKIGGGPTASRYPSGFTLQYSSNDSDWTTLGSPTGLSYPGAYTLSSLISVP